MKATMRPEKLAFVLVPVLIFSGLNAFAQSEEPPAPGVLESFLCSYVDGKDRGDLDAATDFYKKQAAKAGVKTPQAYLWTKVKGTSDAQVIWHSLHASLAAFGAQLDAEAASAEMTAVTERFESVVNCTPLLGEVMPVHRRGEMDPAANRFIVSYACRTMGVPNPTDFADLNRHIAGVLGGMGDASPLATIAVSPITSDPTGPNAVYFNLFENVSGWAAFEQQLAGSESGQMLIRHFTSMLNCATNMWASEQVIAAE